MNRTELENMTIVEMKALAKRKKIAVPAGAKKADIIKALLKGADTKAAGKVKEGAAKRTGAGSKKAAVKSAGVRKAAAPKAARKPIPAETGPRREWQLPPGVEETFMEQAKVEGAKYFTGFADRGHGHGQTLPAEYGEERVVLLARDPDTAFCYWEVRQDRLESEQRISGKGSKLCVRIYDITGVSWDGTNATSFFDQQVYERIGSWYFEMKRPGHVFCADIGVLSPEGRFRTLARSGMMKMPTDGISDVLDEEWMMLDEEFMRLYGIHVRPGSGLSSADIQEAIRRRMMMEVSSPGARSR